MFVDEFNKFCRLCLQRQEKLISIYQESQIIQKLLYEFYLVKINVDDPFSTKLCKSCMDDFSEIVKKRTKYKENDNLLRSFLDLQNDKPSTFSSSETKHKGQKVATENKPAEASLNCEKIDSESIQENETKSVLKTQVTSNKKIDSETKSKVTGDKQINSESKSKVTGGKKTDSLSKSKVTSDQTSGSEFDSRISVIKNNSNSKSISKSKVISDKQIDSESKSRVTNGNKIDSELDSQITLNKNDSLSKSAVTSDEKIDSELDSRISLIKNGTPSKSKVASDEKIHSASSSQTSAIKIDILSKSQSSDKKLVNKLSTPINHEPKPKNLALSENHFKLKSTTSSNCDQKETILKQPAPSTTAIIKKNLLSILNKSSSNKIISESSTKQILIQSVEVPLASTDFVLPIVTQENVSTVHQPSSSHVQPDSEPTTTKNTISTNSIEITQNNNKNDTFSTMLDIQTDLPLSDTLIPMTQKLYLKLCNQNLKKKLETHPTPEKITTQIEVPRQTNVEQNKIPLLSNTSKSTTSETTATTITTNEENKISIEIPVNRKSVDNQQIIQNNEISKPNATFSIRHESKSKTSADKIEHNLPNNPMKSSQNLNNSFNTQKSEDIKLIASLPPITPNYVINRSKYNAIPSIGNNILLDKKIDNQPTAQRCEIKSVEISSISKNGEHKDKSEVKRSVEATKEADNITKIVVPNSSNQKELFGDESNRRGNLENIETHQNYTRIEFCSTPKTYQNEYLTFAQEITKEESDLKSIKKSPLSTHHESKSKNLSLSENQFTPKTTAMPKLADKETIFKQQTVITGNRLSSSRRSVTGNFSDKITNEPSSKRTLLHSLDIPHTSTNYAPPVIVQEISRVIDSFSSHDKPDSQPITAQNTTSTNSLVISQNHEKNETSSTIHEIQTVPNETPPTFTSYEPKNQTITQDKSETSCRQPATSTTALNIPPINNIDTLHIDKRNETLSTMQDAETKLDETPLLHTNFESESKTLAQTNVPPNEKSNEKVPVTQKLHLLFLERLNCDSPKNSNCGRKTLSEKERNSPPVEVHQEISSQTSPHFASKDVGRRTLLKLSRPKIVKTPKSQNHELIEKEHSTPNKIITPKKDPNSHTPASIHENKIHTEIKQSQKREKVNTQQNKTTTEIDVLVTHKKVEEQKTEMDIPVKIACTTQESKTKTSSVKIKQNNDNILIKSPQKWHTSNTQENNKTSDDMCELQGTLITRLTSFFPITPSSVPKLQENIFVPSTFSNSALPKEVTKNTDINKNIEVDKNINVPKNMKDAKNTAATKITEVVKTSQAAKNTDNTKNLNIQKEQFVDKSNTIKNIAFQKSDEIISNETKTNKQELSLTSKEMTKKLAIINQQSSKSVLLEGHNKQIKNNQILSPKPTISSNFPSQEKEEEKKKHENTKEQEKLIQEILFLNIQSTLKSALHNSNVNFESNIVNKKVETKERTNKTEVEAIIEQSVKNNMRNQKEQFKNKTERIADSDLEKIGVADSIEFGKKERKKETRETQKEQYGNVTNAKHNQRKNDVVENTKLAKKEDNRTKFTVSDLNSKKENVEHKNNKIENINLQKSNGIIKNTDIVKETKVYEKDSNICDLTHLCNINEEMNQNIRKRIRPTKDISEIHNTQSILQHNKYTKYIHPSVIKMFKNNSSIKIPIYFWWCNFEATVDVNRDPNPWPRYKESKIQDSPKSKQIKKTFKDGVKSIKVSYKASDPTFHCSAAGKKQNCELQNNNINIVSDKNVQSSNQSVFKSCSVDLTKNNGCFKLESPRADNKQKEKANDQSRTLNSQIPLSKTNNNRFNKTQTSTIEDGTKGVKDSDNVKSDAETSLNLPIDLSFDIASDVKHRRRQTQPIERYGCVLNYGDNDQILDVIHNEAQHGSTIYNYDHHRPDLTNLKCSTLQIVDESTEEIKKRYNHLEDEIPMKHNLKKVKVKLDFSESNNKETREPRTPNKRKRISEIESSERKSELLEENPTTSKKKIIILSESDQRNESFEENKICSKEKITCSFERSESLREDIASSEKIISFSEYKKDEKLEGEQTCCNNKVSSSTERVSLGEGETSSAKKIISFSESETKAESLKEHHLVSEKKTLITSENECKSLDEAQVWSRRENGSENSGEINFSLTITSEEKWNQFFMSTTEDASSMDDSLFYFQSNGSNERPVHICNICEKVYYTYPRYLKHVLNHEKPKLKKNLKKKIAILEC